MKTQTILYAVIMAFITFTFTTCEGPAGPAGADGEAGITGTDGTTFVWKGSYTDEAEFESENGAPKDGWAYYDESLKQSRIYSEGAWHTLAEQGIPGEGGGDGNTPYIGENGNWWIGSTDLGILADGVIAITAPTRTGYSQYESFTSAGLVVRAYYTDGSVATVNSGYRMYWNDTLLIDGNYAITQETGYKTITVQWQNKVASFDIRVLPPSSNLQVYDENTWKQALSTISAGGNGTSTERKGYVIEVIEGAEVGVEGSRAGNSFGNVSYISVTLKGEGRLYLTSQGRLIYLTSNQTLIIDSEDLTMEGMSSNNTAVVNMESNSTLELRRGTISGNTSASTSTSTGNGGVYVYNGSFIMSGGSISGNTSSGATGSGGGGVYFTNGSFTMSGGSISGNTSAATSSTNSGGGGVYFSSGTFNMSGGSISGNTSTSSGGGVYLRSNAGVTFTMSGGEITGNESQGNYPDNKGGGIWIGANANFTKTNTGNSGIISGNSSNTAYNVNGQQVQWDSSPRRYVNDAIGETDELSTNSDHAGYANWLSE